MAYYFGWDVGTWKCTDGNNKSCDALVIMDESQILGHCRRNISELIAELAVSGGDKARLFATSVLSNCGVQAEYSPNVQIVIAIDTPLGWPRGFRGLLKGNLPCGWRYCGDRSDIENPILYRKTEQELKSGFSVVTHSIGSQSTKGMALIYALGASQESWGVWKKDNITLIETYPKACLRSKQFVAWIAGMNLKYDVREWYRPVNKETKKREKSLLIQDDTFDAGVCACLAHAFAKSPSKLVFPPDAEFEDEKLEGWIFHPAEDLIPESLADKYSCITNSVCITTFGEAVKAFQLHIETRAKATSRTPITAELL